MPGKHDHGVPMAGVPMAGLPVEPVRRDGMYRDLADAEESALCPEGCGCRLDTDDADRRECGCTGPCTAPPHRESFRAAARQYLFACGIDATPDAISQLDEAFLPCLRIMCDRDDHPWSPDGATWRESGRKGVLTDVRKKFGRFWYRYWIKGKEHPDSGYDLINFIGFVLRSEDNGWNEWGEPE